MKTISVRSLRTYSASEQSYIKTNHFPFYSALFEAENGYKPQAPMQANKSTSQVTNKSKLEDYTMAELEVLRGRNPSVYRMLFSQKYGYDPMPKGSKPLSKQAPNVIGESKLEDYSMDELLVLKAENPLAYKMLFSNKYGYDPMPKTH